MVLTLTLKIKKHLQTVFKKFSYSIFHLIYGKVVVSENSIVKNKDIVENTIYVSEEREYKLHKLSNCRLYTDRIHSTSAINKNILIKNASFEIDDDYKSFSKTNSIVLKNGTPRFIKKINGSVLSLLTGGGGNENYFHWMFDVLPRIGIFNQLLKLKDLDFLLVPSYSKKFQRETLDLLDFSKKQILSSVDYRHILPTQLYVVQHPYCINNFNEDELKIPGWISKWLKKIFLNQIKKSTKNFPPKFYIDRGESPFAKGRKIVNEDEVKIFLKKKGFIPVQLSKLNFIDQVKLFNNANHIIGFHGAGFSNIVFCKEKTNILEFRTINTGKLYENIGIQNNLNFKKIEYPSLSKEKLFQQGDISVDTKDIESLIN